jgi:hypothetical protein
LESRVIFVIICVLGLCILFALGIKRDYLSEDTESGILAVYVLVGLLRVRNCKL